MESDKKNACALKSPQNSSHIHSSRKLFIKCTQPVHRIDFPSTLKTMRVDIIYLKENNISPRKSEKVIERRKKQ
jgi:hypothetical protein